MLEIAEKFFPAASDLFLVSVSYCSSLFTQIDNATITVSDNAVNASVDIVCFDDHVFDDRTSHKQLQCACDSDVTQLMEDHAVSDCRLGTDTLFCNIP